MNAHKPLGDRVLVKPLPAEEKLAGGLLYVPDNAKEKPARGTVIAVGDGRDGKPPCVNAGDRVVYGKYSGVEIKLDGETFMVLREDEIILRLAE